MAEASDAAREVRFRTAVDQDLDVFFGHQADPEAAEMAASPARQGPVRGALVPAPPRPLAK